MKTLAFTGHRPSVLGGWDEDNDKAMQIKRDTSALVENAVMSGFRVFRLGMAQGFDTWAMECALQLREEYPQTHVTAAVPFPQFPNVWPKAAQERYYGLLERCDSIVTVSLKSADYSAEQLRELAKLPSPELDVPYQAAKWNDQRNHWMIDGCDALLACWNRHAKGGTFNAVRYARKKGCQIITYNPDTREVAQEKARPTRPARNSSKSEAPKTMGIIDE